MAPPADRHAEPSLLIADVAGLTGVAPPQLRSWEAAGLLRPRRLPNGTRLYGPEDVARVRLVARSLVNPGRRGSLRRLGAALARGELRPIPEDYALLAPAAAALGGARFWRSVVESMAALVVVCDPEGRATAMNPALRSALALPEPTPASEALPAALRALPLRWAALTGTQHRDVPLALLGPDGAPQPTLWDVAPLRDEGGVAYGAVGVGRPGPADPGGQAEWLVSAAHDLRGPATVILGRVELAQHAAARAAAAGAADPGEAAAQLGRHLAVAKVATLDLIRSMGTLLDAEAAAAGALIAQLEPGGVELGALAREAVEHAREHTSRHQIGLGAPPGPLLVAGDRVRLRQVLDNLLANAIKYAPDGGEVAVTLEAAATPPAGPHPLGGTARRPGDPPAWALLRVRDDGLGMAAAAVPHVFERFWRAQGPARQVPGSGLGLYTCRAVAAAHGGHIWVEESVEQDGDAGQGWHGTQIALLLPLAGPAGSTAL